MSRLSIRQRPSFDEPLPAGTEETRKKAAAAGPTVAHDRDGYFDGLYTLEPRIAALDPTEAGRHAIRTLLGVLHSLGRDAATAALDHEPAINPARKAAVHAFLTEAERMAGRRGGADMLKFHCPSSGKPLRCPPTMAGKRLSCPACHQQIDVPAETDPPQEPAPAAVRLDSEPGLAVPALIVPPPVVVAPIAEAVPETPTAAALESRHDYFAPGSYTRTDSHRVPYMAPGLRARLGPLIPPADRPEAPP